jgi:glycosyltransferase involved in cell wall biosynthesis
MLDGLLARPIEGLVSVADARGPLRVLIASLAPGGAERIVVEWIGSEAARGRKIDLAVLHERRHALRLPPRVFARIRASAAPRDFVAELALEWRGDDIPVATHLVGDELLAVLWEQGIRTIPTVHNARDGWRNDPAAWNARDVPLAIACADHVRDELLAAGCRVPVVTLRHRPKVSAAAFDREVRAGIRAELGIGAGTFLVAAVGALKPQKDHRRAVEVLAKLAARRDAVLMILGGVLDDRGLAELDRLVAAALELGVSDRLRLPGFVPAIEPYLAAADALLNVSRFEGYSMAVQEALAAGLPVVATDVAGHRESGAGILGRVAVDAPPDEIAQCLARLPIRMKLEGNPALRAPRAWSLPLGWRAPRAHAAATIFVTANLNAGGAQRSLVNLARGLQPHHRLALAVCGETTHAHFAAELDAARVDHFRPAAQADPIAAAESLLAHSAKATTLCFWNADARVKLAVTKFARPGLRIVDASPGHYAFAEMEAAAEFAGAISYSVAAYYERLDVLVLKYSAASHPPCREVVVIPNGVAVRAATPGTPAHPRFLVSGRIAPSKRLETIIEAFARLHRAYPAATLDVIGPVEERHVDYAARIAAQASGLPVSFRGPSFDLAYLDEAFSAAVVLGTHQGCPNAVLEAMAAGIAVIANDSGGTGELIPGPRHGWLLPEDADVAALADAMTQAMDPAQAALRAQAARARVGAEFSMERMARRYLEIFAPENTTARARPAWVK